MKKACFICLLLGALALALAFACESGSSSTGLSGGGSDGDSDADSDADGDGDADSDADGDADGDGDTDTVCDEDEFIIEPVPVSLMILLDRSSSMVTNSDAPPTRWSQAISAIETLLTTWDNPYIRFGFDYFPDGSQWSDFGTIADCGVSYDVQVDCADDNNDEVMDYLDLTDPPPDAGNMTPMWCAMDNFNDPSYATGFMDADAQPYLLMISDGSDTCGLDCNCLDTPETCGDPAYGATAEELGDLSAELVTNGVKTFVIGFGGGVDWTKLNPIAANGGTGITSYIDALDEAELLEAFDMIGEAIVSCSYEIDVDWDTVNPDEVNFYFDGEVVPYIGDDGDCDELDGWHWTNDEHTAMEFCGTYCDELKSGDVELVEAMFGCPTVELE